MTTRSVVVAATLDTKWESVQVLLDEFARRQQPTIVIDCGLSEPAGIVADISRDEVEARGAPIVTDSSGLHRARLAVMASGLASTIAELVSTQRLAGFVSLGGGTGASLASQAFAEIPFGTPKMLISTGVTDGARAAVGDTDVILVQPVVDFIGDNALLDVNLRRAAAAMSAMLTVDPLAPIPGRLRVGITAFGVTTAAAEQVVTLLRERGHEALVFHARGSGGRAMEQLIAQQSIDAVIDLTTTEIVDEVAGGLRSAGPNRLSNAVLRGIPLVVAPGAIDVLNFEGIETVPVESQSRALLRHTPTTTLVRSSAGENARVAAWIARALLVNPGHSTVLVPLKGFSSLDIERGPFFDPAADEQFVHTLQTELADRVPVTLVDAHINEREFAEALVEALHSLIHQSIQES